MSDVRPRIYRVKGVMLIGHDRNPSWQKFVKEVRALNEREALEKVYSILGSNHKVKRRHVKIESVEEITPEECTEKFVRDLSQAERLILP
ncbi:MAG: 50S ribosomal protein L18Ae [Desulfurococcaceae archaeon]